MKRNPPVREETMRCMGFVSLLLGLVACLEDEVELVACGDTTEEAFKPYTPQRLNVLEWKGVETFVAEVELQNLCDETITIESMSMLLHIPEGVAVDWMATFDSPNELSVSKKDSNRVAMPRGRYVAGQYILEYDFEPVNIELLPGEAIRPTFIIEDMGDIPSMNADIAFGVEREGSEMHWWVNSGFPF